MKPMNSNSHRTASSFGLPAILLLFSASIAAAPGVQVKVDGLDDAAVDRAAIQAAIDSAPGQNLIVKLSGTFQLDGQDIIVDRSNITIKGDKQGVLLKGKLGPDGGPIDDIGNFPNRGFLIESADALANIEIKDLAMTGLRTPIFVRAGLNTIESVEVRGNSVQNSFFGVTAFGQASDIRIVNNRVTGATSFAVYVFGAVIGRPSNISILDNHLSDAWDDALTLGDVDGVTVANNFLSTAELLPFPAPLFVYGFNSDVVITGNTLEGGSMGAALFDTSADFTLTKNCIRNGGTQGRESFRSGGISVGFAPFGVPGSGFEIMDNSYENNLADYPAVPRDVWLTPNSSANAVVERIETVVLDQGTANSVDVLADDGINYCDD